MLLTTVFTTWLNRLEEQVLRKGLSDIFIYSSFLEWRVCSSSIRSTAGSPAALRTRSRLEDGEDNGPSAALGAWRWAGTLFDTASAAGLSLDWAHLAEDGTIRRAWDWAGLHRRDYPLDFATFGHTLHKGGRRTLRSGCIHPASLHEAEDSDGPGRRLGCTNLPDGEEGTGVPGPFTAPSYRPSSSLPSLSRRVHRVVGDRTAASGCGPEDLKQQKG
ncbi:hypothetical protein CC2G_009979 [Coprinopsis cinerea AmutBmut pab1-1]|nr:hypothetical protein CC2G_009979 [Coprinopsis cinerea AmutBmut pab1-1]